MSLAIVAIFAALVVFAVFWLIKMEHHMSKAKVISIAVLLLLLYLSVSTVLTKSEVDLKSPSGIINGIYIYIGWLGSTVSNLWDVGTDTTGRVIEAVSINETKT